MAGHRGHHLLGALTFAALAVAIGYRFAPDTVQPVAMLAYFAMSILGAVVRAGRLDTPIGQGLPTYQITRIGTDLISGGTVPVTSTGIILAWLAAFTLLAVLAVRSTAETL